jgi:heptosyltransferase-2
MKIFIEIPTWLGDAVMTTPSIENIVQSYTDVKLTIFGSYVSTRLFVNHPNVEKIILDESRKGGYRYYNLYKIAKSSGKFDFSLSFRKNFTTKFLCYFVEAKIAYIYTRFDKELKTHQVIRYNDFINKSLNLNTVPNKLKIYKGNEIKEKNNDRKKLLGLNPGATYGSAKRWYPQEFAKVAMSLAHKYDIQIYGGPGETEIAADIEKSLKENGIKNYENLAGQTSVDELIENISNLDLFITNDSGPMHLASAFQIPTVAIFGPTREIETHQWSNEHEMILRKDVDCGPCMKRVCPLTDEVQQHKCMKLITADNVIERLKQESII